LFDSRADELELMQDQQHCRVCLTAHYGSIELATDTRTVNKINYLDIVWIAHTGRTGL
jgi:hypothetical protein